LEDVHMGIGDEISVIDLPEPRDAIPAAQSIIAIWAEGHTQHPTQSIVLRHVIDVAAEAAQFGTGFHFPHPCRAVSVVNVRVAASSEGIGAIWAKRYAPHIAGVTDEMAYCCPRLGIPQPHLALSSTRQHIASVGTKCAAKHRADLMRELTHFLTALDIP
jgi:hypothetical protein